MTELPDNRATHKIAYEFHVEGPSAEEVARQCQSWMAVNYQTSVVAYNGDTNDVRIAMLIEAATPEDAVREAGNQLSLLKEDIGDEAPEISVPISAWPQWAEQMIAPLVYSCKHGEFPPGFYEAK